MKWETPKNSKKNALREKWETLKNSKLQRENSKKTTAFSQAKNWVSPIAKIWLKTNSFKSKNREECSCHFRLFFKIFMRFEHLRSLATEHPFNDLWPPTQLNIVHYNCQVRSLWFYWLKQGWVNNTPFKDLSWAPYYQARAEETSRKIAERNRNLAELRRRRTLYHRRRYKTSKPDRYIIGQFYLRNRVVVKWKRV